MSVYRGLVWADHTSFCSRRFAVVRDVFACASGRAGGLALNRFDLLVERFGSVRRERRSASRRAEICDSLA